MKSYWWRLLGRKPEFSCLQYLCWKISNTKLMKNKKKEHFDRVAVCRPVFLCIFTLLYYITLVLKIKLFEWKTVTIIDFIFSGVTRTLKGVVWSYQFVLFLPVSPEILPKMHGFWCNLRFSISECIDETGNIY